MRVPALVRSVNAGLATVPGMKRPSAIRKHPVDAIEVRDPGPKRGGLGSGVVGDGIGSRRHHGGETQAVYAVAREEMDWWGAELGRDLADGMFGENLAAGDRRSMLRRSASSGASVPPCWRSAGRGCRVGPSPSTWPSRAG